MPCFFSTQVQTRSCMSNIVPYLGLVVLSPRVLLLTILKKGVGLKSWHQFQVKHAILGMDCSPKVCHTLGLETIKIGFVIHIIGTTRELWSRVKNETS